MIFCTQCEKTPRWIKTSDEQESSSNNKPSDMSAREKGADDWLRSTSDAPDKFRVSWHNTFADHHGEESTRGETEKEEV